MAKDSSLHMRVNSELKSDAEKIFSSVGLNTTAAVTLFLKQTVNQGCLPFKIETSIEDRKVKS